METTKNSWRRLLLFSFIVYEIFEQWNLKKEINEQTHKLSQTSEETSSIIIWTELAFDRGSDVDSVRIFCNIV